MMWKLILIGLVIAIGSYYLMPNSNYHNTLDDGKKQIDSVINILKNNESSTIDKVEELADGLTYVDYGMPYNKEFFVCESDIQCFLHLSDKIEGIKCNETNGHCYILK